MLIAVIILSIVVIILGALLWDYNIELSIIREQSLQDLQAYLSDNKPLQKSNEKLKSECHRWAVVRRLVKMNASVQIYRNKEDYYFSVIQVPSLKPNIDEGFYKFIATNNFSAGIDWLNKIEEGLK